MKCVAFTEKIPLLLNFKLKVIQNNEKKKNSNSLNAWSAELASLVYVGSKFNILSFYVFFGETRLLFMFFLHLGKALVNYLSYAG